MWCTSPKVYIFYITRSIGFLLAPQTPLTAPLSDRLTLLTDELSLSATKMVPDVRSKQIPDG